MRRGAASVVFGTVVFFSLMMVGLVLVLPLVGGFDRYVITGGSMTGAIPKGALIYARQVPVSSLKAGDIITYVPPGGKAPVTHRIYSVTKARHGQLVFRTKGDFNKSADPWLFTLNHPTQARYVFQIPFLGYALAALTLPLARVLLLAVPAFVIALVILRGLWQDAGEEIARQRRVAIAAGKATAEPS